LIAHDISFLIVKKIKGIIVTSGHGGALACMEQGFICVKI